MREKEKAKNLRKERKPFAPFARFLLGTLAFSLVSCSARGEAKAKSPEAERSSEISLGEGGGAKRLAESLTSSLASGLSLKLSEMTLKADEKNTFVFNDASLSFSLSDLSLHGLDFALEAEVDYNGSGGRSIDARLVDDELYFALGVSTSASANYDVAYKVSTASYEYGEEGSRDTSTGGITQYEFGRLDWVLDDILLILSSYGYEVKPHIGETSSTIDFSKISASLDELNEIDAETHYFVWNLPLGETTYSIGLQGDEDYCLSKIDFPAKGTGASNKLSNGMELSLSAELDYNGVTISAPSNASAYRTLDNSIDLWERIATYAGKLSFCLSTTHEENGVEESGLLLTHHEDEVESTATTIGRSGFDEKVTFSLDGSANFQNQRINDLSASAVFKGEKQTKKLSGHYVQDEADKEAYLDINGILKVKTSKTTADAFFSAFADLLGDESIRNEYLSSLFSAINSIGDAFESLKSSLLGKDISEKHYEHFLEALISLESKDNEIEATFDFGKAGGEGKLIFHLSGSDFALVSLTFDKLSLGGFGVSGTLKISDYTGEASFNRDEYEEMDHLPSLAEQVENLYQHHSAKATVKGYVLDRNTTTNIGADSRFASLSGKTISEQGFSIDGDFAFNLQEKAAYGQAVILDRKADYLNEHALSIQLDGEIGSSAETGDMLFSYDSSNDKQSVGAEGYKDLDYGNISEPSNGTLYGKFSVSSLNDILGLATTLLSSDDPRFTKFTAAADTLATTLVAKIAQGQFAPLLTERILVSATRASDKISAVISKEVLGSEEDVSLNIAFNENGLSSLDFNLITSTKEIYFKIDVEVPSSTLSKADLQLSNLESKRDSMTDFSSLSTLLEYLLGSATLGEDENSVSTYRLNGEASISIVSIIDLDISFSVNVSLDGAEVKAVGALKIPLVKGLLTDGINGGGNAGGERYVEFYFHTSGNDEDGTILFHRVNLKKYTWPKSNATNEDWAKVKTSDFTANIANWALGYIVGLSSSTVDSITSSSSSDEKGSSLHGEDIISSYSHSESSGVQTWNAKMDLSSLSNVLCDPLEITIEGKEVNAGSKKQKTLTSLSGSIGLVESPITSTTLITISFNASLANVSSGTYVSAWDKNSDSECSKLAFHSPNGTSLSETSTNAASAYESNYYNNGYVSSLSSVTLYVTAPSS